MISILLQDIFGFWKCLFVPQSMNTQETEAAIQIWSILVRDGELIPEQRRERHQQLLFSVINAHEALLEEEIAEGLNHIAAKLGISITESRLRNIMDRVRSLRSESNEPDIQDGSSAVSKGIGRTYSKIELSKMKVSELRDLAVGQGLRASGTKKDLIERLIALFTSASIPSKQSASRVLSKPNTSLILILDHRLQEFPWEAMDIMGHCGGVTRMPSLELLLKNTIQLISADQSAAAVRCDRVRFLVNPEGDLRSTQTQLGPVLEDGEVRFGWQGIVGRIPEPNEMRCVSPCCNRGISSSY